MNTTTDDLAIVPDQSVTSCLRCKRPLTESTLAIARNGRVLKTCIKCKTFMGNYYQSNRDKQILATTNRRARALGVPGTLELEEFLQFKASQPEHCYYCKLVAPQLQLDHKIALSAYRQGNQKATNTLDNLVFACEFCNRAKGDREAEVFVGWLNFIKNMGDHTNCYAC